MPENVPGDFFVDSTCIDCDACRQIAPSVFGEAAETSFVKAQPKSTADRRQALQALLACPTGSIGCLGDDDVKAVMKDFPLVVAEPVFYCGYNSPKSYGGNSYFIRHAEGNWLIDSPKFVTPLVKQLEALGGIAHIFLTHRDDVADAERRQRTFSGAGASFIGRNSRHSPVQKSSLMAKGPAVGVGFRLPRHRDTGPHQGPLCPALPGPLPLHGRPPGLGSGRAAALGLRGLLLVLVAATGRVDAAPAEYRFEWVLPGHGQKVLLPTGEMRAQILRLAETMRAG